MRKIHYFGFSLLLIACSGNTANFSDQKADSTRTADSSGNEATTPNHESLILEAPKVFYWNQDDRINQDIPLAMTQDSAIAIMKNLPKTDGNFFGLQRGENEIIQFMHTDDRGLIIDIPNLKDGPFDEPITMDECLKAISYFYDGMTDDEIAAEFQ